MRRAHLIAPLLLFLGIALVASQTLAADFTGRVVGVVLLPDGRSLNRELVRAGFAWWYRRYAPDDTTLDQLEREARGAQRGL